MMGADTPAEVVRGEGGHLCRPLPLASCPPPPHLSQGHWLVARSGGWEGLRPPGIPLHSPFSAVAWPDQAQVQVSTAEEAPQVVVFRPPQFVSSVRGATGVCTLAFPGAGLALPQFSGGLPSRKDQVPVGVGGRHLSPSPGPAPPRVPPPALAPPPAPLPPARGPSGPWRPSSWTAARLWRRRVSAAQGKAPGPAPPPRAVRGRRPERAFPRPLFWSFV